MQNMLCKTIKRRAIFLALALMMFIINHMNVDTMNAKKMMNMAKIAPVTIKINNMYQGQPASKRIRNKTETPPQTYKCKCHLIDVEKSDIILSQYSSKIPWLNETTGNYLDRRHPNWPSHFFFKRLKFKSCSFLPTEFNIEWRNTYWQEVSLSNGRKLLLYSAFYDTRKLSNEGPCVRLLGVTRSVELPNAWCHLWFDHKSPPVVSQLINAEYIDRQPKDDARQMPYLLTCNIPKEMENLQLNAVSLVTEPCSLASNILKVIGSVERAPAANASGKKPKTSSMWSNWKHKQPHLEEHTPAVCGTALYYYQEDFSIRIVEWLEMLRALKISKVYLHLTTVHPNIEKVLRHYEKEGFVSVTLYSYPPPYINEPSTRRMWTLVEERKMWAQENIYFTDCLLRHMHQHRFIAHFDPDEVPVLPHHSNFPQFLEELLTKYIRKGKDSGRGSSIPGYQLHWRYFSNDIKSRGPASELPEYLWILRHIRRPVWDVRPSNSGTFKTLYDMNLVRGVYSHGVLRCITGSCYKDMKQIPIDYAYLAHFRGTCGSKCEIDGATTEELTLHKHKENVSMAVKRVLEELELI